MSSISWPTYFAAERTNFQRALRIIISILLTPEDTQNAERLSFSHTIADRSSFPGPLSTLQSAIKTAESTKEHLAQRHLSANINCLTHMFIDHPKEGRSSCFRSRLITILDYCRRLCEQLKDERDGERAGKVAEALDLVVVQIGRLTLNGVVDGDGEAMRAEGMAREKEGVFKRARRRGEGGEVEELRLVWNALQFQGWGRGGCGCRPCLELEKTVRLSRRRSGE